MKPAELPKPTKPANQWRGLAGWLLLSFAAGAIGGLGSVHAPVFYALLTKPSWAPPAALFGPVWSVLYVLIGVAAWLAWRQGRLAPKSRATALFVAQLLVNALWTWLFFAWHQGGLALLDVVLLWLLIAANIVVFWRMNRVAGLLLLPYLAWVSFAAALTWSVWRLNPQLLG